MPYDINGVWYDNSAETGADLKSSAANTANTIKDNYDSATQNIGSLSTLQANAQSYVAPTSEDLAVTGSTVKSGDSYMKDDYSVASQLSKLLSSDSDYMKQVDAKSKVQANQLGMLSSDRYIGAATGAAIREGLPIATADANTAAKFGLQQQQGENTLATTSMEGLVSGALKTNEASLNQATMKVQGAIDSYLQSAASQSDTTLTGLKAQLSYSTEDALKKLENSLNKDYISADYSQQTAENTRSQAASQIENTMISIENILKDPDILQLGSDAVAQIMNNEIALMRSSIELTYNLAKLNPDSYISGLLDNFEDSYDWSSVG